MIVVFYFIRQIQTLFNPKWSIECMQCNVQRVNIDSTYISDKNSYFEFPLSVIKMRGLHSGNIYIFDISNLCLRNISLVRNGT